MEQQPLMVFGNLGDDLTATQKEFMDALCLIIIENTKPPQWEELASLLKWGESSFWGCVGHLTQKCYANYDRKTGQIRLVDKGLTYYHYYGGSSVNSLTPTALDMSFAVVNLEPSTRTVEELDVLIAQLQQQRELLAAPKMRVCLRCEHEKPIEEFQRSNPKSADGIQWWCAECRRQNDKNKNKNRTHIRAIVDIVQDEGRGRLASTAIKELVAELAALEDAVPFVLAVKAFIDARVEKNKKKS